MNAHTWYGTNRQTPFFFIENKSQLGWNGPDNSPTTVEIVTNDNGRVHVMTAEQVGPKGLATTTAVAAAEATAAATAQCLAWEAGWAAVRSRR